MWFLLIPVTPVPLIKFTRFRLSPRYLPKPSVHQGETSVRCVNSRIFVHLISFRYWYIPLLAAACVRRRQMSYLFPQWVLSIIMYSYLFVVMKEAVPLLGGGGEGCEEVCASRRVKRAEWAGRRARAAGAAAALLLLPALYLIGRPQHRLLRPPWYPQPETSTIVTPTHPGTNRTVSVKQALHRPLPLNILTLPFQLIVLTYSLSILISSL